MIPAFVGKNIQKWYEDGKLPADIAKYGNSVEEIFITSEVLKNKYGKAFKKLPWGAIAMYTFVDRLTLGLKQLMAGARKFSIEYIERNDIVALTKEASEVTGIPYVMEADMEEAKKNSGWKIIGISRIKLIIKFYLKERLYLSFIQF